MASRPTEAQVSVSARRYLFASYELDARTGELHKMGMRLRLQEQPLQILLALLERPGEVVSREQLIARLWPAGTFVDFDLGLNAAVRRLRDLLNDSAENPRYIETLPRLGYRFIAAVEVLAEREAAAPHGEAEAAATAPTVSWSWGLRAATAAGLFLVALAIGLGAWRWTQPRPTLEFSQRDWVLISRFENRTGNPSLDGSLETLLEREISNSHYVNVAPAERVGDTLRLMRLSMEGRPPLAVAREVAVRDGGIKAVITGRAERIGGRYVIGASVLLPADGVIVSSYTEEAASEEQIVPALRRLSDRLRERLGEDLADIRRSAEALEKVTTPSLPALRLFSQAMPYQLQDDCGTAAPLLERALRADPSFATAHAYLAHCYMDLDELKRAAPHWEEAMRLSGQVTEAERLFIVGGYYERYQPDPKKALEAYETLVSLYPSHYWAMAGLAEIYGSLPQTDDLDRKLAVYTLRAADLRPTDFMSNYLTWESMVGVADLQRASVYRARALRVLTPEDRERLNGPLSNLRLHPVIEKLYAGDLGAAVSELEALRRRDSQGETPAEYDPHTVFRLETALGRLEAAEAWEQQFPPSGETHTQLYYLAWMRNDHSSQIAHLRQIPPDWWTIYALAHSGRLAEAQQRIPEIERIMNRRTGGLKERREGLARGELALQRGNLRTAARQCEETLSATKWKNAGTYWLAAECEARALEQQHDLEGAVRVLERMARPEPSFLTRQFWLLSEANRVRLYRQLGRAADADRVAHRLERLLSVADADHPARAILAASKPSQNQARAAAVTPTAH